MNVIEGKTKIIRPAEEPGAVYLETKDELTGGDAAKRESIPGIARAKTAQAANVFVYLEGRGVPTAFIERAGENTLRCHACDMLPLELVIRRYAWGSMLKREPALIREDGKPHRFDELRCEFYHKHAVIGPPAESTARQVTEEEARALYLHEGTWAAGVYTDPMIRFGGTRWALYPAKIPTEQAASVLEIDPVCSEQEVDSLIEVIMKPCFTALEEAWAGIETEHGPVALADMKIEVGRRERDGKLVVADVIDNDSWRIWPGSDPVRQLDKQCFREDHPLGEVAEKYELVAGLTARFTG